MNAGSSVSEGYSALQVGQVEQKQINPLGLDTQSHSGLGEVARKSTLKHIA